MPKRLQIIFIALIFPLAAAAEEAPAPAPEAMTQPAPAATPATAASTGLGPQSAGTGGGGGGGGSNADAAALQPAGLSPLQSTTSDSTGLTAPASALQAPVTGDANLKVLAGEADGAPHQVEETSTGIWSWLVASLLVALVVGGVSTLLRDRRRFAATER